MYLHININKHWVISSQKCPAYYCIILYYTNVINIYIYILVDNYFNRIVLAQYA